MSDDLPVIRDNLGAPPLDGDSILLRNAPGQVGPLSHDQFDHNVYLLAKQTIANYNARQGQYITGSDIMDGALEARHFASNQIPAEAISGDFQNALVPPGTLFPFAGTTWSTSNTDFLLCDGRIVASSQYPNLYAAISTTYDANAAAGNFRIPDLRGRFVMGALGQAPNDNTRVEGVVGETVYGEDKHAVTVAEMPSHTHEFVSARDHRSIDDGHDDAHGFSRGVAPYQSDTLRRFSQIMSTAERQAFIEDEAGWRAANPNKDPFDGGSDGSDGNASGHFNDTNWGRTYQGNTKGPGGDTPHNNVPPSLAINYLIKT